MYVGLKCCLEYFYKSEKNMQPISRCNNSESPGCKFNFSYNPRRIYTVFHLRPRLCGFLCHVHLFHILKRFFVNVFFRLYCWCHLYSNSYHCATKCFMFFTSLTKKANLVQKKKLTQKKIFWENWLLNAQYILVMKYNLYIMKKKVLILSL